jgi:hypothetical protein
MYFWPYLTHMGGLSVWTFGQVRAVIKAGDDLQHERNPDAFIPLVGTTESTPTHESARHCAALDHPPEGALGVISAFAP